MLQTLLESGREAQRTGAWDEALAHYDTALAMIPDGHNPKDPAEVLRWSGMVHAERGGVEEALKLFEQSRSTAEAGGLKDETAAAYICLANVELLRGNLDQAADVFLRARDPRSSVPRRFPCRVDPVGPGRYHCRRGREWHQVFRRWVPWTRRF